MIRFIEFARTAFISLASSFTLFGIFLLVLGGELNLIVLNFVLAVVLFLCWAGLSDVGRGAR